MPARTPNLRRSASGNRCSYQNCCQTTPTDAHLFALQFRSFVRQASGCELLRDSHRKLCARVRTTESQRFWPNEAKFDSALWVPKAGTAKRTSATKVVVPCGSTGNCNVGTAFKRPTSLQLCAKATLEPCPLLWVHLLAYRLQRGAVRSNEPIDAGRTLCPNLLSACCHGRINPTRTRERGSDGTSARAPRILLRSSTAITAAVVAAVITIAAGGIGNLIR